MESIYKKILIGCLIFASIKTNAQIDNGTSSNPSNPIPSTGVGSNRWDWTSQVGTGSFDGNGAKFYKINPNSTMYPNYVVPPIQGYPIGIESPYYNSAATQLSQYVAFGTNSDYKWSNGWELITRNFGYAYDEVTTAITDATVPYFVLYNKYSGTIRVFGVLPTKGGGGNVNSVTVELKFLTPADEQHNPNYANYKYSALLGVNGGTTNPDLDTGIPAGKSQALDVATTINNVSKVCPFTGYDNQFFYSDFSVGYDPCSCWNQGGLQVSFFTNVTGTITLSGRFVGTSKSMADVINGSNTFDPVDYLAAVNTQGTSVKAGTLVYEDINEYASELLASETGNSKTNPELISDLDKFSKGTALIAKGAALSGNEEVAAAFEAMSALSDFIASFLPEEGETATASVIQGEMALTGGLTMNSQNPEAFIKFSIPGTPTVANPPEFYTANNPIPNKVKYNEVLGPFALLQTPAVNVSRFKIPFRVLNGNLTNYYYRDEFQITDAVKYIFNPAVHANLSKSVVLAALDLEYIGSPNSTPFPIIGGFSVRGAKWTYTNQVNSSRISSHYMTDYVDPSQLSNLIVATENNNGYSGSFAEWNVYLKLIVNVVSNDLKSDGETPNQSLLLFTYPINVYNANSTNPVNLTGFPLSIIGDGTCDCAAPNNLTISAHNYSSSQTVYAWDQITINGTLTASTGVHVNVETYEGTIAMSPGASAGPGIALVYGHPQLASNPSTGPWTGIGNLQTWCAGGANSNLPNPYKANTLGSSIPAARLSAKPHHGVLESEMGSGDLVGSLKVAPNPISAISGLMYTLPNDGNVEISIHNMFGEKVKDLFNGYRGKGDYQDLISSESMESGVYILTLKAEGYSDTQKIVITK